MTTDAAAVMVWMSDDRGHCTWVDPSWLEFAGQTLDQVLGDGWTACVHPDDREQSLAAYRRAVDARQPISMEFRLRRKDGTYRLVKHSGAPRNDPRGRFAGFVGSCVDVTVHREAEARLLASEARFRLLAENAPAMLWLSDAHGRCLHLNRRLRAFWGIANEDLETFDWTSTMHPDDAPRVGAVVGDAIAQCRGFAIEARYRNCAGQYRILRTEAEPLHSNTAPLGFIGVNIDVTEEVEATAALKRSEDRFVRFMTHLPGLAWIKDHDGRYVFANQAAASAFGRTVDDLIGRTDDEIFPSDIAEQFKRNDADARSQRGGIQVIETLPQTDGILHHSLVSKFAIPATDGSNTMTAGVAIDVTDRKAAEDRIKVLNEDLRHQVEEREALLAALPVGVFMARDAACRHITMNSAGAAMLRLPQSAAPPTSGSDPMSLPFDVARDGLERTSIELTMQRAVQLQQPIVGDEIEVTVPDQSRISLLASAMPLFGATGQVRGCISVCVDISERKRSEQHMSLLIDELNHRAKNLLAIVQSIASQTLRTASDPEVFTAAFTKRLEALSRAHTLLTRTTWQGAPLRELATEALAAFAAVGERVAISGPPIVVAPSIVVTLCLILHELATNAVKHGALRTPGGKLSVSWSRESAGTTLTWHEACEFKVVPPTRSGFGSRLISVSAGQLGGSAQLDYAPGGLVARLTFQS